MADAAVRRAGGSRTRVDPHEPKHDDEEHNDDGENGRDYFGHPDPERYIKYRDQQKR
jgi:hypothetical protein